MKYLYYTKNEDGELVFWRQGHGYTDLSNATVYDATTSKVIDHLGRGVGTGIWYGTEQPELAAIELMLAEILRDNYDINLASLAGSEHVARQLASKLGEHWIRISADEAAKLAEGLHAIMHDYQQAPFYETVESVWAFTACLENGIGKHGYLLVKPIIEGYTDVTK